MKFSKLFLMSLLCCFFNSESGGPGGPNDKDLSADDLFASAPPAPTRRWNICKKPSHCECAKCHTSRMDMKEEKQEELQWRRENCVIFTFYYKDVTFNDIDWRDDCCYCVKILQCHCPDLCKEHQFEIEFEKKDLTVEKVYEEVIKKIGNRNIEIRVGLAERYREITERDLKEKSFRVRLKERCCCCANYNGMACCKS